METHGWVVLRLPWVGEWGHQLSRAAEWATEKLLGFAL